MRCKIALVVGVVACGCAEGGAGDERLDAPPRSAPSSEPAADGHSHALDVDWVRFSEEEIHRSAAAVVRGRVVEQGALGGLEALGRPALLRLGQRGCREQPENGGRRDEDRADAHANLPMLACWLAELLSTFAALARWMVPLFRGKNENSAGNDLREAAEHTSAGQRGTALPGSGSQGIFARHLI